MEYVLHLQEGKEQNKAFLESREISMLMCADDTRNKAEGEGQLGLGLTQTCKT